MAEWSYNGARTLTCVWAWGGPVWRCRRFQESFLPNWGSCNEGGITHIVTLINGSPAVIVREFRNDVFLTISYSRLMEAVMQCELTWGLRWWGGSLQAWTHGPLWYPRSACPALEGRQSSSSFPSQALWTPFHQDLPLPIAQTTQHTALRSGFKGQGSEVITLEMVRWVRMGSISSMRERKK